ncbi:hypothetical protein PQ472_07875 [Lacticaseibacillus pabuli]|uniref:Uncharacterized protein n=1 Tax=Lacticaseibacillus pabuli TaxID=3025672 RepID=A0ABY7WNT1_9LACO|nr:hypothetical protein [Lacticaseibacillus sp. KACC 23028]WDF81843.1 hypothetical protein PQ472_07875 [Lacticaseibacillus sp. KACC 23028]
MILSADYLRQHGFRLWYLVDADYKREWESLMIMKGADYFPDLYAKPIAPAMKRWRRLRRLLIQQTVAEERDAPLDKEEHE